MADVFIITVAFLTFVVVERRPRPAHLASAHVLVLITGVWIWANLRPTGWQEEVGGMVPPRELDPVTRGMFFRGWPLSPCWFSIIHGMRFHADSIQPVVLVLDWIILVVALSLAKFACERRLFRRDAPPPSGDLPEHRRGKRN